jgi:purine-nucleoside phosphorylase
MATVRTLVLSAWDPEVAPLARLLRAHPPHAKGVALAAVGVGTVDAGVGAAHAIARTKPARVIFVGTAGVYPSAARAFAIGDSALADDVRLVSSAALRGEAYHPAPLVAAASTTKSLRAALARANGPDLLPVANVACPVAITKAPALARRLGATGAALENLEAFAVARAAEAAGLPFAAVLGISNIVGPKAHEEWRTHHLGASRAACHVVWQWMKGGEVKRHDAKAPSRIRTKI